MKTVAHTVATILVTSIATFCVQVLTEYLTRDVGTIAIGAPVKVADMSFAPVEVVNFGPHPLNDIHLTIPTGVATEDITATGPIQIRQVPDAVPAAGMQLIALSSLPAQKSTLILVPLEEAGERSVNVLNGADQRLEVLTADRATSQVEAAFWRALSKSWILLLGYAVLMWWLRLEYTDTRNRLDEVKKHRDAIQAQMEDIENRADRLKILLGARLHDYSTELEFWRNTAAAYLRQGGRSEKDVEGFLNSVTDSLKTYSTRRGTQFDFKAVEIMAKMLHRPVKSAHSGNDTGGTGPSS